MKNENEWIKFYHRVWLEDERILRMSLAAQGLYLRALCYQARHGNLPAKTSELELVLNVPAQTDDTWNSVLSHFAHEDVNGEERLYNKKLREIVILRDNIRRTKSENRKNGCKTSEKHPKKNRKSDDALRVRAGARSSSLSSSLSKKVLEDSFNKFWTVYPRKEAKQKAFDSWCSISPDAALCDSIVQHVTDRVANDEQWRKEGGRFVMLPTTFLNQKRWTDEYSKGGGYTQRIEQYDPNAAEPLDDADLLAGSEVGF